MNTFSDRKASYKLPPGSVLDKSQTQQARRAKALEEQKRRRAKRIESERHIDLFADLNLGQSDDETETGNSEIVRGGIGSIAKLMPPIHPPSETSSQAVDTEIVDAPALAPTKRKYKRKKGSSKKLSPWADQCMYAELLEMKVDDDAWMPSTDAEDADGLPSDLHSGWVAVSPVPAGKRCLAVCHQGSGAVGVVPNTTLRSRVLGKPLMPRFPSHLPSDTVLDCILDENWHDNGILHVLDVLKWKGQDLAECETSFRFWWRDTRLSELPPPRPPTISAPTSSDGRYKFPYPISLSPITYYMDTTPGHLLSNIIPRARTSYSLPISVPTLETPMELDGSPTEASVRADGLLLYVAQAIYEPGTSPLSLWVPAIPMRVEKDSMEEDGPSALDCFERLVKKRVARTEGGSMHV
ncbi:hypothetical protein OF83DRAFT_1163628 [Amylostereum chailletii]|nr:hypothetical protein OF83DRAFT_1163628 [Amylostereum chailletii]